MKDKLFILAYWAVLFVLLVMRGEPGYPRGPERAYLKRLRRKHNGHKYL